MSNNEISPAQAKRLLWAGFMAILAAGVGFAIRGGIFDNWSSEYGFSATDLGKIGGMGFAGFCFGIIIGGVLCDKFGYGKLVFAAFFFHVDFCVQVEGLLIGDQARVLLGQQACAYQRQAGG